MNPRSRTFEWKSPTAQLQGLTGLQFLEATVRGEIPPAPFHSALNLRLVSAEDGFVRASAELGEFDHNLLGTVHGGFISSLLDTVLGCAVLSTLGVDVRFTTLDLQIHLVRGMTAALGHVFAEGRIVHGGRQVCTSEAKVLDASGKLYAHGTSTCLVIPAKPGAATSGS